MPPILIDTNALVYLYDMKSPIKAALAREVIERLDLTRTGRLSVQNLAEFFRVATGNLDPPLSYEDAMTQISLFMRLFPVYDLTAMIVLEAVRGARDQPYPITTHRFGRLRALIRSR